MARGKKTNKEEVKVNQPETTKTSSEETKTPQNVGMTKETAKALSSVFVEAVKTQGKISLSDNLDSIVSAAKQKVSIDASKVNFIANLSSSLIHLGLGFFIGPNELVYLPAVLSPDVLKRLRQEVSFVNALTKGMIKGFTSLSEAELTDLMRKAQNTPITLVDRAKKMGITIGKVSIESLKTAEEKKSLDNYTEQLKKQKKKDEDKKKVETI